MWRWERTTRRISGMDYNLLGRKTGAPAHEIRMTHGDMGIHPLLPLMHPLFPLVLPPFDYLRAHSGQAALRIFLGRIYLVHLCRRSS